MLLLQNGETYVQAASKVEVITDHNPLLQWLKRQPDPRGSSRGG